MKKFFVVLSLVAMFFVMTACKEKRCACTYTRALGNNSYMYSHSLEPKAGHSNCSELDKTWEASDSSSNLISKSCIDEE